MASMPVMPRSGEWTVDDLAAIEDDGLQYELADGVLLVTPAPHWRHQDVVGNLYLLLRKAVPEELKVYVAPLDFQPTNRRSLQPDLLVVRRLDLAGRALVAPPLLVVEVLSPSTRAKDLVLKRSLYADSGVPSYWVVDPDEPSVVVLELSGTAYVETQRVVGDAVLAVDRPYSLSFTPASLLV